MAHWKDAIRNHGARKALEDLYNEILDDEGFDEKETDAFVGRLSVVLDRGIRLLSAGDERFLPKKALESILTNTNNIRPAWESLRAQRAAPNLHQQYIDQMDPHIDQVLLQLAQIRAITTPITKDSAFEKLGNIKVDAETKIREIEAELLSDVEEISQTLTTLEEKSSALTIQINEEKTRADALITQFQSEFNSGQKERDEKFKTKLDKEYSSKLNKELDTFQHRFDKLEDQKIEKIRHLDSESERLIAVLDGHIKKAGLVAQSIAEKAIQSQFAQNAADEKKEASKWANRTLILSILLIVVIGAILYWSIAQNQPISAETFLPKALILLVLVGVARWTAKLEKRHTDEARKYKQLSLELETIAPFIATLSEAEQQGITKLLVDRYFVGRSAHNQEQPAKDQDDSFTHPIQQFGDAIRTSLTKKD